MNVVPDDTPVRPRAIPGAGEADPLRLLLHEALRELDGSDTPDAKECAHHIARALKLHLAAAEGMHRWQRVSGGLAAWQVRRVEALALAHLDTAVSVAQLADACHLSRGYFTRAFKATFGVSPHRWRQRRQIERASDLLRNSTTPLADIAGLCGFCDQAHLTRVFRTAKGVTPHAYRVHATAGGSPPASLPPEADKT